MISLIIPTNGTNKNYTDNLITNIRDLYPNENEVEIVLHEDDTITLGLNYNNAVAKAKGDKVILLHNDMVLSRGFIETMDKHIKKGRITTYTRIEPPIFMDEYPGKIIMDFGSDLTNFNQTSFDLVLGAENLIEGGSQLFFGCMKEDYIGIDGYTFKMFCEDDDLHLRYKLARFEHKVSSAHVYHFVSKTSRTGDYQNVERNSNINFIRKWGSRTPIVKYNIAYVVKHANIQIVEALEPWCDRLYIEDDMQVITDSYREMEQCNTNFDLTRRIYTTSLNDPEGENDIIVEFDTRNFSQQSLNVLMQLPEIIKQSGEVGQFELDIFKITINSMVEYQNDLIYLKNT
jgi:hypothetical protein